MNELATQQREADLDVSEWSDEDLLEEFKVSNREDCFNELVTRYEEILFRHIQKQVFNEALAADVLQNVLLLIFLKKDLYESGRKVRTWILSIATNQAIDVLRKENKHTMTSLDRKIVGEEESAPLIDLLPAGVEPPARLEQEEERKIMRSNIDRLPGIFKSTLYLSYYEDLSPQEISGRLGIKVGAVQWRKRTALLKMRELLLQQQQDLDQLS